MSTKRNPTEAQLNIGDIPSVDYSVSYGKPGSYMDVAARSHYLLVALDAISQRNIRDGLSVAAFTMPASGDIWGHYQENTEDVLNGADKNRANYEQILRVSFWKATGFAALRGSGLMRERQINPRARKMWRDFNHQFGHGEMVKNRNKYKKKLDKTLIYAMTIKEKNITGEVAA